MQGADVAQLRNFAKEIQRGGQQLRSLETSLSAAINATSAWKGGDAAQFRADWTSNKRKLLSTTSAALDQAAKVVLTNADEQEKASDGATGSSGGGGGQDGGGGSGEDGRPKIDGTASASKNKSLLDILMDAKGVWGGLTGGLWRSLPSSLVSLAKLAPVIRAFSWSDEAYLLKAMAGSKWFAADALLAKAGKALGGSGWGTMLAGAAGKLGTLGAEGGVLSKVASGLGGAAKVLGPIGKALGPVGVAFTGVSAVNDFANGRPVRGTLNSAATVMGAAALMTPPPANVILGAGAAGIAVGQLVYDNWDNITEFGGKVVGAVGDAGKAVVDGVGNTVKSVGKGISKVADAVWPF